MPNLTIPSAREVACPTCAAEPGTMCHTSSGAPTGWHTTRWAALKAAKPYSESTLTLRGTSGPVTERVQVTRTVEIDGLPVSEAAQVLLRAAEGLTEPRVEVMADGCDCCSVSAEVSVIGFQS